MDEPLTLKHAADRVGVSPSTLRRWADSGVIPQVDGSGRWSAAAVAHARIVARLRERGHRLEQIREAGRQGRLAYGYIADVLAGDEPPRSLKEAADATGLEPALVERFWASVGFPPAGSSASATTTYGPCTTSPPCSKPASRSSPSSSCAASTASRFPRSPTPRCGCSTSTSTSR